MTNTTMSDPHLASVTNLAKAEDWAGLLRYWMAFQYRPALERATDLARERAEPSPKGVGFLGRLFGRPREDDGRWKCLLSLLELLHKDLSSRKLPSDWELFQWSEAEQVALTLLTPYVEAFLCEAAKQAQPRQQEALFAQGLFQAEVGYVLAKRLDDRGVQAMFLSLIARGNQNLAELERAGRSLKGHPSAVTRAHVHKALEDLGLLGVMSELQIARVCYTKALDIYTVLDAKQPGTCTPIIAERFNNLGYIQRDLDDLGAARASFAEALQIYRKLSGCQPELYRRFLAATLNNLGSVQSSDPNAARASFAEALQLYRILEIEDPAYYRPLIDAMVQVIGDSESVPPPSRVDTNVGGDDGTTAVYWLEQGMLLDRVGRWKEAVACYQRALEIDCKLVPAWSHKGNSLLQAGMKDDALQCFRKALELDGKYAKAWVGKGDVLSNSLLDEKGGVLLNLLDKRGILAKIEVLEEAIEAYNNFIRFASPELRGYIKDIETRCQQLEAAKEFFATLLESAQ